jgi:hypothetical protein
VNADGKRRRSRRPLILVGALALLTGLAFLVARPSVPDPITNPYAGKRGGSRDKSAGLLIRYRRGDEMRSVEPQTVLRAGDVLGFKVRGEEASYLEVRLRDGAAAAQTIFPTGGAPLAAKVSPGDSLPVAPAVASGAFLRPAPADRCRAGSRHADDHGGRRQRIAAGNRHWCQASRRIPATKPGRR